MTEEQIPSSSAQTAFSVVVLCGQPGCGKTTLAHKYASSIKPEAKIFSYRPFIESFLAQLIGCQENCFAEPRCNSFAMMMDTERLSYGQIFDDFYSMARMSLPYHIWIGYVAQQIQKELDNASGARNFVIDDVLQADEVEFLSKLKGANVATIYLDGNPGKKPRNSARTSFGYRAALKDVASSEPGFFLLLTDKQDFETEPECIDRCVASMKICLLATKEQNK